MSNETHPKTKANFPDVVDAPRSFASANVINVRRRNADVDIEIRDGSNDLQNLVEAPSTPMVKPSPAPSMTVSTNMAEHGAYSRIDLETTQRSQTDYNNQLTEFSRRVLPVRGRNPSHTRFVGGQVLLTDFENHCRFIPPSSVCCPPAVLTSTVLSASDVLAGCARRNAGGPTRRHQLHRRQRRRQQPTFVFPTSCR